MLSHFHPIPERYGQTDGRTELSYQYRASVRQYVARVSSQKLSLYSVFVLGR